MGDFKMRDKSLFTTIVQKVIYPCHSCIIYPCQEQFRSHSPMGKESRCFSVILSNKTFISTSGLCYSILFSQHSYCSYYYHNYSPFTHLLLSFHLWLSRILHLFYSYYYHLPFTGDGSGQCAGPLAAVGKSGYALFRAIRIYYIAHNRSATNMLLCCQRLLK